MAEQRAWVQTNWGLGSLLIFIAVILFVLATFGVDIGGHGLIAPGLAFFAAGHLL